MGAVTAAALGLAAGIIVGYGAGRRAERVAQAWEVTRSSMIVTRSLAGQAVGWVLGAALLLACAGVVLWVAG